MKFLQFIRAWFWCPEGYQKNGTFVGNFTNKWNENLYIIFTNTSAVSVYNRAGTLVGTNIGWPVILCPAMWATNNGGGYYYGL